MRMRTAAAVRLGTISPSAGFPLVKCHTPLCLLELVTFSGTVAMHTFVPALTIAGPDLRVDAACWRRPGSEPLSSDRASSAAIQFYSLAF
jgi:hypothetical protein